MTLDLDAIVGELQRHRGVEHKRDIAHAVRTLGVADPQASVPVGDDCAAIPDGHGGWQLLAIEGFINEFVAHDPWFAGWCGVMVNVSDIAAMGGRATAVVDAVWARGDKRLGRVLEGLAAASRAYGVPVVGGHSNAHGGREQLSVAILGRARALLTSFDARPGDVLIAAIDLRGAWREPYPHWNAATEADPARLRADLDVLPRLAEDGLCRAAKDISGAGLLGTMLMLLECSGVGATLDLSRVPMPPDVEASKWLLSTFPSYGFLLSVPPGNANAVLQRFQQRGIGGAVIGEVQRNHCLQLRDGHGAERLAWDFRQQALTGCGPDLSTAALTITG